MLKRNNCEEKKGEKVSPQKGRKPYQKPQLITFGHIEKLTKGTAGTGHDKMGRVKPD